MSEIKILLPPPAVGGGHDASALPKGSGEGLWIKSLTVRLCLWMVDRLSYN